MTLPSDLDIAQAAKLQPIIHIARNIGLTEDDFDLYGRYKAKVHLDVRDRLRDETLRRAGGMPLRPELEEQIKVQAEKNVKIGVALGKVIELEKIEEKEQAMRQALDKLVAIATR